MHPAACTRPWLALALVALVALAAPACATGSPVVDGDDPDPLNPPTAPEAGVTPDARVSDSASDTSSPDGAGPDGAPPDAARDASPVDAARDASPVDASPVDASPVDGGPVDAGPVDAGACVTAPPSNACGVNPQCGCTATQTCDVTNLTSGAVSCVGAGSAAAGRACTTTSGCARGLTCWNGACRPFCSRGTPTCGPGTLCFAPQDAGGVTTPNLDVCSVQCDPSRASAVCGTNACVWFASAGVADCRPPGTRPEYGACTSTADCRQGLVCINDPIFGPECQRWCRVGSNADCSFGDRCSDVLGASAPTVPGTGARIGLCVF
ncbi:MAG: hypothetical protein IPF92_04335 [Myxococcales bacterium]|nr:hypothetical protein [Myxococcales bacterium]MBL0197796.1 hypothetical protein [Myxococcales bacterium]